MFFLLKSLARYFGHSSKHNPTQPAAPLPASTGNAALRPDWVRQPVVAGNSGAVQRQFPDKDNLFKRLLACGVPISEVVDVGVRECTFELIVNFPKLKHHLFEPAKAFFPVIAENYKYIDHRLYPKALGSSNEMRYLVATALRKDGVATHSGISATRPAVVDGREIVSAEEFRIERFDTLGIEMAMNSLLKVDVDGLDSEVLRGFGEQLKRASVVIVEAITGVAVERINLLNAAGFTLIDMVDLVYYGPSLYQLDLCFVRNDLITDTLWPDITRFDGALWTPIARSREC